MKKQVLLITGANGVIGSELLTKFQLYGNFDKILALVHTKPPNDLEPSRRLEIIYGDVTQKNLGLIKTDYKNMARKVTAIIHCAANTKFSLPLEDALKINYKGSVSVAKFAEECTNLEKFAFLSTVYVAGKRIGLIKENELQHNQGFVNTYEKSKYEAEMYFKEAKNRLPLNVYRLSTVIGRSTDGQVPKFNAVHLALKLYFHSLIPFIPAHPKTKVDFVSVDFVTKAISHIFQHKFKSGETYHIVSGKENATSIADLIEGTYQAFLEYKPSWTRKTIEKPAIVDLSTFELFSKSAKELKNPVFLQVMRSMETFVPQLVYPKDFDCAKTQTILNEAGISPQSLKDYYNKVVKYRLLTNWGRKTYGQKEIH